jgi:hypothetical protein
MQLIVETTKSGDDSAVGRALDDLAVAGSPVLLTGSFGETRQKLDGLEMHKILGLDNEGRVTNISQGKDLLWTLRAEQPDDDFAGARQFLATLTPSIKNVSLVYRDDGAANAATLENFTQALLFEGMTLASAAPTPDRSEKFLPSWPAQARPPRCDLCRRDGCRSEAVHPPVQGCRAG